MKVTVKTDSKQALTVEDVETGQAVSWASKTAWFLKTEGGWLGLTSFTHTSRLPYYSAASCGPLTVADVECVLEVIQ